MKDKKIILGLLFIVSLFLVGTISAYSYSTYRYDSPGVSKYGAENYQQKCEEGQDFIFQIAPFGCTPSIVPSALLEEQDVTVFCQIEAFKVNPLIDVDAIKSISITGQYPRSVRSVGFFPSRAAIDREVYLDESFSNNVGYVAITLKQQRNASAIEEFISGNLTARISYDIENAFNIGRATYYIPSLGDDEWDEKRGQYSFWNKLGILKVEEITENSAEIEVYQENKKVAGVNLDEGESSNYIYLPGMDCSAGFKLRLDSIESPDIRAKLNINGEVLELQKGDTFQDGKCQVRDVEKVGILETTTISCKDDSQGRKTVELTSVPKIELKIDGISEEFDFGQRIFKTEDNGEDRFVYLGYVQEVDVLGESKTIDAEFVIFHEDKGVKLSLSDLATVERVATSFEYQQNKGQSNVFEITKNMFNSAVGNIQRAIKGVFEGTKFVGIKQGGTKKLVNSQVEFVGLAEPRDLILEGEILDNYNSAIHEYDLILDGFAGTRYPDGEEKTKGQETIEAKIKLMYFLDLKKSVQEICDLYVEKYGEINDSSLEKICSKEGLSNSKISVQRFTINKKLIDINLEGVYEPTFSDAGAVVYVKGVEDSNALEKYNLELNKVVYLDDEGNFMRLVDLSKDSIKVEISLQKGLFKEGKDILFDSNEVLRIDESKNFGSKYSFTLDKVNLVESAKVTVLPKIDPNYGTADFRFNVAVEKRAIQLSPTKIKEKIAGLKDTIARWEGFSDNVGKVVDGLNTACMATGAYFTLKNLLSNAFFSGGEGLARDNVMNGKGGWNDRCEALVEEGDFASKEKCLLEKSDEIDLEVEEYRQIIESQNEKIKEMQASGDYTQVSSIFGDQLDNDALRKAYLSDSYRTELKTNLNDIFPNGNVEIQGRTVGIEEFVDGLNSSLISMDELKSLELNSQLSGGLREGELISVIGGISSVQARELELADFNQRTGIPLEKTSFVSTIDYKSMPYLGLTFGEAKEGFGLNTEFLDDVPVAIIYDASGKRYLYILENQGNKYTEKKVYDSGGIEISPPYSFYFEEYDENTYKNHYSYPVLRYYEEEPYKGLPAIVPFDLNEGWYATIQHRSGSYDASGRVESFYLCNVGKNEKEDEMGEDDICQSFNLATCQTYSEFPKLSTTKAKKKVDEAVKAIEAASKAYKSGVSDVEINGKKIKVGEPKVDVPAIECTDFLSPKECNIWFNACDPVLCPRSRCDFGGKYPVSNVVQSGVIGSLVLCLPNWDEGIYLPVCMTGVKAGLDSWISVQKNYQSCLEHNLETGEVVGVCDEIQSIYACEFFWEQAMPLISAGKDLFSEKVLILGGHFLNFPKFCLKNGKFQKTFKRFKIFKH